MLYNSVNLRYVTLPLGKGGHVDVASNFDECQLTAMFDKVYINDIKIPYPFLMVLIRELSMSHTGRRTIKYSDKISYNQKGRIISNQSFFRIARNKLGLSQEACWFIYEVNVRNQDELRFKAIIVNKDFSEYYSDSVDRKESWTSLIP